MRSIFRRTYEKAAQKLRISGNAKSQDADKK
jgi:hypothetical protein